MVSVPNGSEQPKAGMKGKAIMSEDPELAAMATVKKAIEGLEGDEIKKRVLLWAMDRFKISTQPKKNDNDGDASFTTFADLYDAASPKTDADRALVGGYWLQKEKGLEVFNSGNVNKELKDLGHGASNITKAFNFLIGQSPRLAMQVRKSGSSRQARKEYKLTREGLKKVADMTNSLSGK